MVFKEKVKCPHGGTKRCIRPSTCSHAYWHQWSGECDKNVCEGNGYKQVGCKCEKVETIEDSLFEI